MYSRSAAFDQAIQYSHTMTAQAVVLIDGRVASDPLPVLDGRVDVDATAAWRRRGTLRVVDDDGTLTPTGSADLLSPYGHEVRISKGVGSELLSIATLRISSAVGDGRVINLSCFDRARSVARNRFETPYTVAAGTNYGTAIQNLLSNRLPGVQFNFVTTTSTTPLLVFDQAADPWKSAQNMADSIGCELFFDPAGVCAMRSEPNPATTAVSWEYVSGPTSMLLNASATLVDEPGWNGVVCDGEAPGFAPVHSVVYDLDPSSPTYSLGPYGKVPYFMRSQFITSQLQCDMAATAGFLRERGGTEQVRMNVIGHPGHEGGDVVRVADGTIDSNYVLETFSVPLSVTQTTTMVSRKRRTL